MLHFITGDRSVHPLAAMFPVAVEVIKIMSTDKDATFATGDNAGVESAVALLGLAAGLEITLVASPLNADGSVDWDARHTSLANDPTVRVTFLHGDLLASRVGKSLVATFPEDRLDLATGPDLL